MLRLGFKNRKVAHLPWFPTIKADNVRSVFFSDDEFDRLVPALETACAAANIPERRLPHDFRRTAACSYRCNGVSEGVVMKILGHKTRSIFERYNIKNEDDLRDAAAAVAEMRRNGKKRASVAPVTSTPNRPTS